MRPSLFPWDFPELLATDRALMAMIVEGRFDFLMFNPAKTSAGTHRDIRKWIAQLQAVRP